MRTTKFNGKVYEVKPTGKVINKPSKSYYDFNGYWTEKPAERRVQLGLYDNGVLIYTVGADGKSIYNGANNKFGDVLIRDTETDPYAHKLV